MANRKFYVVWVGHSPGVYGTWGECREQVDGFSGAKFKSFPTIKVANKAYSEGYKAHWGKKKKPKRKKKRSIEDGKRPEGKYLCVDAAWNPITKIMEYRGVLMPDSEVVFSEGPYDDSTNNIGEGLAIVHGLVWLQNHFLDEIPLYTDSAIGMSWVRKKKFKSDNLKRGLVSELMAELVELAENWLQENEYKTQIMKWHTRSWGEIPADYGRK